MRILTVSGEFMDLHSALKIIIINIFSFVFYIRLSRIKVIRLKKVIAGLVFIAVFTVIMCISRIFLEEPYRSILIIFLSSVFLRTVTKENFDSVLIFMSVAYAASHILYLLSTAAALFIMILLFKIHIADYRTALLTGIIEAVLTAFIMKIRIELPVSQKGTGSTGLVLSGISVILYSLFRNDGMTNKSLAVIFSGVVLCAAGFLYWLKRETVITFNDKVKDRENSRLKEENNFLDSNLSYLEKRLHREDKRLPAYQKAVEELIKNTSDEAGKQKAFKVLSEIKNARKELSKEQFNEHKKYINFPSTGMALFDSLIAYMADIAAQKYIEFDFKTSGDLSGILKIITQTELETLAADLIKNAITACEYSDIDYKNILVDFKSANGIYEFSVKDNGIPFEPGILSELGKIRVTTHAETGGSGIGFMTVFEICSSCKASIIISESGLYKTVAVRFDGEGGYAVRSCDEPYRSRESAELPDI
jgi:hypothetical protein